LKVEARTQTRNAGQSQQGALQPGRETLRRQEAVGAEHREPDRSGQESEQALPNRHPVQFRGRKLFGDGDRRQHQAGERVPRQGGEQTVHGASKPIERRAMLS
jgi:hypothetical protein